MLGGDHLVHTSGGTHRCGIEKYAPCSHVTERAKVCGEPVHKVVLFITYVAREAKDMNVVHVLGAARVLEDTLFALTAVSFGCG